MGCDIHLHIEVKLEGEWRHYAAPRCPRDYEVFTIIAGVRGCHTVDPISEPKGLPEDLTYMTRFDANYWESDGHSHSWLNLREIQLLEEWWKQNRAAFFEARFLSSTYLFGNSFSSFKEYPDTNRANVEDVRFVFWFDC